MILEMMTCLPIQASVSVIPSLDYDCIKDGYSETDLGYKKQKKWENSNAFVKYKQILIIPL